ncbi:hypothetical protein BU24DRAFT_486340 [Aaosphaeria arxii CBS 175.79]|uniref:Uncharacterized protein n=1 Tax=Aaosphaeria arxii CBS 175.79 TaxID=1450172 RepID=A0A6A5XFI7_9PLEO|nr:uncharacterized protein BU24DRAFT_486340 [Aaosphaeria arxii CBS 175.79]KAF2011587.1 hypothetical protein BU24DRAFT_486340 [Aaosphaeria arxii CBS 175.79]
MSSYQNPSSLMGPHGPDNPSGGQGPKSRHPNPNKRRRDAMKAGGQPENDFEREWLRMRQRNAVTDRYVPRSSRWDERSRRGRDRHVPVFITRFVKIPAWTLIVAVMMRADMIPIGVEEVLTGIREDMIALEAGQGRFPIAVDLRGKIGPTGADQGPFPGVASIRGNAIAIGAGQDAFHVAGSRGNMIAAEAGQGPFPNVASIRRNTIAVDAGQDLRHIAGSRGDTIVTGADQGRISVLIGTHGETDPIGAGLGRFLVAGSRADKIVTRAGPGQALVPSDIRGSTIAA